MTLPGPDDCPPPPPVGAGLHTLMLHEACDSAGGVAQLAELLGVPAEQLTRWLDGDETPPEEIYRACAEIVLLGEDGPASS